MIKKFNQLKQAADIHSSRYYHKLRNLLKRGTTDFFSVVEVETITTCNRQCSYCPNSVFERGLLKNQKLMKEEVFYKIVDELGNLGFEGRFAPHFYCEPLLDKRLPKLLSYARKKLKKAKIWIFTNGDLLTLDRYKEISNHIDVLYISRHSSIPQKLKEVFADIKKINNGVKVVVEEVSPNDSLFNRGGLIKVNNQMKLKKCDLSGVMIDYSGNVILCCNDYLSSCVLGNLKNQKIIDIWNSTNFKNIRRNLKKGVFDLDLCKKCVSD